MSWWQSDRELTPEEEAMSGTFSEKRAQVARLTKHPSEARSWLRRRQRSRQSDEDRGSDA